MDIEKLFRKLIYNAIAGAQLEFFFVFCHFTMEIVKNANLISKEWRQLKKCQRLMQF